MAAILGIGGYHHDAAAALLVGGRISGAVAEERLTRVKHQAGIPHRAAAALLQQAGLDGRDVTEVAVFWAPLKAAAEGVRYRLSRLPHDPLAATAYLGYELYLAMRLKYEVERFARSLNPRARVSFVDHHRAHAAAAFYTSGAPRAAILSVDAFGERVSTWLGLGDASGLTALSEDRFPHSLGSLYAAVTQYLGFADLDDFKVMGLAPYGTDHLVPRFREVVRLNGQGRIRLDLDLFSFPDRPSLEGLISPRFEQAFGPRRRSGAPLQDHHRDVARAVQTVLEEALLGLAREVHHRTGCEVVCLAGGVSLNSVAAGRILAEGPFDEVWVQPAAADDGTALGAALARANPDGSSRVSRRLDSVFLGPDLTDADCERALERAGVAYSRPRGMARKAARALAAGRIVARATGRSEWGPRALGHRSILADPRDPATRDRLNAKVKNRESFRPFAPAITKERAAEFFDIPGPSPFMTMVFPARAIASEQCPAVVHVDGTARVQTVSPQAQPGLHAWLSAFEQQTGVPVLLNTSFNVRGEPIVQSAEDALRCFFSTGIDALALGPFWVDKQ